MKAELVYRVLSIICALGIVVLATACQNQMNGLTQTAIQTAIVTSNQSPTAPATRPKTVPKTPSPKDQASAAQATGQAAAYATAIWSQATADNQRLSQTETANKTAAVQAMNAVIYTATQNAQNNAATASAARAAQATASIAQAEELASLSRLPVLIQVENGIIQVDPAGTQDKIVEPRPDAELISFQASQDRQTLVLLYELQDRSYNLDIFYPAPDSQATRVDLGKLPDGAQILYALSPDGDRLTVIFQVGCNLSYYRTIYLVDTGDPGQKQRVADCGKEADDSCSGCDTPVIWSPDSQLYAWHDNRGVWLADRAAKTYLALANPAPQPDNDAYITLYNVLDWSPQGRYLRLARRLYEGRDQAILDTQTGQVAEIPNSFVHVGSTVEVYWLEDGRLAVKRSGSPVTEIYLLSAGAENLLILVSTKP